SDMPRSLAETRGAWTCVGTARIEAPRTLGSGLVALLLERDLLQPWMHPARHRAQECRRHREQRLELAAIELEAGFAEVLERRLRVAQELAPQRLVGGEPTDHDLHALLAHAVTSWQATGQRPSVTAGVLVPGVARAGRSDRLRRRCTH